MLQLHLTLRSALRCRIALPSGEAPVLSWHRLYWLACGTHGRASSGYGVGPSASTHPLSCVHFGSFPFHVARSLQERTLGLQIRSAHCQLAAVFRLLAALVRIKLAHQSAPASEIDPWRRTTARHGSKASVTQSAGDRADAAFSSRSPQHRSPSASFPKLQVRERLGVCPSCKGQHSRIPERHPG
jgi:hypothetical protein